MLKHESRIGKLNVPTENVYRLISDFSRLKDITPPDEKMKIVHADQDKCRFSINKAGEFGMIILERKENDTVKIINDDSVPFKFTLWIQLKEVEASDTRIKVTLHADLNPMLRMVAKKPLTQFVDGLVDKLENMFN